MQQITSICLKSMIQRESNRECICTYTYRHYLCSKQAAFLNTAARDIALPEKYSFDTTAGVGGGSER